MIDDRKTVQLGKFKDGAFIPLIFAAYAIIIVALWGSGANNGMPSETVLVLWSDKGFGWNFSFYPDALRKFTPLFYHLSYVVGEAFGIPGSFIPYQLVYAALWLGRAVLTFLIVRQLVPDHPLLAAIAGLVVALDTADSAVNWVGTLNLSGAILWMLLGFLFFILAVKARQWPVTVMYAVVAASAAYLTLWTYESPLPVCIAFPIAVAIVSRPIDLRRWAIAVGFLAVPIFIFIFENLERYRTVSGSSTYQSSIMRSDLAAGALGSDLWLHLRHCFAFWQWPQGYYDIEFVIRYLVVFILTVISVLAAVIVAHQREQCTPHPFAVDFPSARLLIVGLGLLIASYLVAILLRDNHRFWRTELLPTFSVGIIVACVVYAGLHRIPWQPVRLIATSAFFFAMAWFSTRAGVNAAQTHQRIWAVHRATIASILYEAPEIADGTLVVLRGVGANNGFIDHNMWFDTALRLVYPKTDVAGIYYLDNGQPAPGKNIRIIEAPPGQAKIPERRAAEGPADERCHHRLSQYREPLSRTQKCERFRTLPANGVGLATGDL